MLQNKYNIVEVDNDEIINIIKKINDLKETNAYILINSASGKEAAKDPVALFVNTARVCGRLICKRLCDKDENGGLIPFGLASKKKTVKKAAKKVSK